MQTSRIGRHEPVAAERIRSARQAFVTRRVDLAAIRSLVTAAAPKPGDLLLASVRALGHHTRLQSPEGRRIRLFPGDEIIVAYGNRYAPQQFEALVPAALERCHLVASGGVAAHAVGWHHRIQGPTEIEPVGLLGYAGGVPANVFDWRIDEQRKCVGRPPVVIGVAGTSMDAGKTTAAAHLIRGLCRAGRRVGAAKLTGTGACNDYHSLLDAGASEVIDFVDAGFVSTHRVDKSILVGIGETLLGRLAQSGLDIAVVEIADGLSQAETAALLETDWARRCLTSIVFCAGDALGARAGVDWLRARGHNVLCLSGVLTAAPLAARESAHLVPGVPVLDLATLSNPAVATRLLQGLVAAVA